MSTARQRLKRVWFRLLGKDPEAVVVSFWTGADEMAGAMVEEVRRLIPGRRHLLVTLGEARLTGVDPVALAPGSAWDLYRALRRRLRGLRIGMAPVLYGADPAFGALRLAAFLLSPRRILAYNTRLERYHLKASRPISSWLFWRGVALDRIHLRPWWLWPWKKDRTVVPTGHRILDGRPLSAKRRRVAVLSPYFPFPLSHGGAVRIYHLLREAAAEFDVFLFAFVEHGQEVEPAPVLEFCDQAVLVEKPRYREPRWSSLAPPEVCEYRSPPMRGLLARLAREWDLDLVQVEYAMLAEYRGQILVEHDVTFDLYRQVLERTRTPGAWWDWWRWRRLETVAARRFSRLVTMSEKDRALLGTPQALVIANGVDLRRFRPEPEPPGMRLLFIGSFRHFPNVAAYRFFVEEVWPRLARGFPEMTLTVVAGPDALVYWRQATSEREPAPPERVRLLEFVRDVRPLYVEANIVLVPVPVSAGTNIKVLEAMAMERAVVSTSAGCAGLGLVHGESVWIADNAEAFAAGVARLAQDGDLRNALARAARRRAEEHFSWDRLGAAQRALWRELLRPSIRLRAAAEGDWEAIARIQAEAPEAARWDAASYAAHELLVADVEGKVAAFLAARQTAAGEREILNLAVEPGHRRRGIAAMLLREELAGHSGAWFLEVRESNHAARGLYQAMGFCDAGVRPGYYDSPDEAAIVMRFQS